MRLGFVGDIALGDHPKTVGFGFGSVYREGIPDSLARRIPPPGPAPEMILGNLEFTLGDSTTSNGLARRQCRGSSEYAAFLARAGVTALNVANNHSFQHGYAAFGNTVQLLRSAGIHVVGTPDDFSETGAVLVNGRRLAILGWSDRPRQYAQERPPYNELSDDAYARIADARRRADVVIASVHWGDEFILLPSARERTIARAMIDAGASCVIGHHPHVMREIEHYAGGVIAYSLGNFIGDMLWDFGTRYTGWLTANLDEGGSWSAELTRGIIDDDYFPRPLTEEELVRFAKRTAVSERRQGRRIHQSDYASVAEEERRRHVRRTAWMMVRNVRRYPRGFAVEIFRNAISHRVRRLMTRPGTEPGGTR